MKVLHIDASLRLAGSASREMSQAFIDHLKAKKDISVDRLDLETERFDHITQLYAEAMYAMPGQYTPEQEKELEISNGLVDRVIDADLLVIGTPTYNFGIPSSLKTLIDLIVRSGRTFMYSEAGFEGQLKDKKVVVINSRGLSYAEEETKANDHVTEYLQTILGFVGITDVQFVYIDPTFFGDEATEAAKSRAKEEFTTIIDRL
ncbi:MAG: NAD(P)H-dependent oxidoreductase [Bacteroidota bacterium]